MTPALGTTSNLIIKDYYSLGSSMAAAMLVSIPVTAIFLFFGIYIGGLTAGALIG